MYVFSYLELHTTLIAWELYALFYDIIVGTGLVIIPLLWSLLTTSARSLGEEDDGDQVTMVKHVKNTIGIIVVLLFCFTPIYPVQPTDVKFQPPVTQGHTPSEVNSTNDPSPYREHFGQSVAPVRIPAWWGLLHSLSAGFTNAAIARFQTPGNLREARMLLESRNIEDPSLASDYNQFLQGCYWRAKDNYQRLARQNVVQPNQDVSWAGSQYLINMPGGYQPCTDKLNCQYAPASLAVQFSTNLEELERRNIGQTCASWWESIRGKILDQARADQAVWRKMWGGITGFLSSSTDREREDLLVRKSIENFHVREGLSAEYTGSGNAGLFQEGVDIVGAIGIVKEWWDMTVLSNVMKQALPIIASVTLLFVVMIIPLALFFTGFSIGAVIRLSFLYFSFMFVHALLAFAAWLDHYLIVMLFQNASADLSAWFMDKDHLFGYAQKEGLINTILMGYYILIPLLWFGLMGAVGVGVGNGMDTLMSGGGVARSMTTSTGGVSSSAGRAAAGTAKTAARGASQASKRWRRMNQ